MKKITKNKVSVALEKRWCIPSKMEKKFSKEIIEQMIEAFNSFGGQRYYIMDYYHRQIIVDSASSSILCGYPKELADKKGFRFFDKVLSTEEWKWLVRVNEEAYHVFFSMPLNMRKKLVLSYDLELNTIHDRKIILHHKIRPFQLCNNGNLWLGLCYVIESNRKKSGYPTIINGKTGEQYEFIGDRFIRQSTYALTDDEKLILELMIKGYKGEHISTELKVSDSSLRRMKFLLYQKIGVNTSAEAVHWAHLNGIF